MATSYYATFAKPEGNWIGLEGFVTSTLPSWISIQERVSHESGDYDIISVSPNKDEHNERIATVINNQHVGSRTHKRWIRQAAKRPIYVDTSKFELSEDGGEIKVAVHRDGYVKKGEEWGYQMSSDYSIPATGLGIGVYVSSSWCNATLSEDEKTLTITFEKNDTGKSRSCNITLKALDYEQFGGELAIDYIPQVLTLNQTEDDILEVLKDNGFVSHRSGILRIPIRAYGNIGNISISGTEDWFSASIQGNYLIIDYSENLSDNRRSAKITLHSEQAGLSVDYVFTQIESVSSESMRLFTWQYSAENAYVVVYYATDEELVLEVWDDTRKALSGEVIIQDVVKSVLDVKFFCVNDTIYLSHPNIHPKKITRVDSTINESGYSFEAKDFDVKIDPILDEYADRNVFSVEGGVFGVGDTVKVVELPLTDGQKRNNAELLFTDDSSWRGEGNQMLMLKKSTEMMKTYAFCYPNSSSSTATSVQTPKPDTVFQDEEGGKGLSSPWVFAFGKVGVETSGKWSGRIVVDLWKPGVAVDEYGEPVTTEQLAVLEVSNASSNKSVSRDLSIVGSRIRIRCEEREKAQSSIVTTKGENADIVYRNADNDTGCYVTLSNAQEIPIYLRIKNVIPPVVDENGVASSGYALCEAIHPFEGGFNSSSFAEGAWCKEYYGYPRAVGVFQERMVFGGNKLKPCTLWCSKTGDWSNFVQGAESTSPIFATANTDNIDSIQWMSIAKSYIMFGSLSGEWYFGSSDGGAVKQSNFSFQKLSNFGSTKGVDAVQFGDATIVAKNGGKEVIDVSYNTLSEQGTGSNLSLFASHLFEASSVKDMACTLSPNSILWILSNDGKLLSFTYEGNNNVFAWSRHEILDGVSAITSFRRGERDILAMLVKDGKDMMLAELDPFAGDNYLPTSKEHIFEDEKADGSFVCYESRMIPTPITAGDGGTYGRKVNIKSLDVYLKTHNGDFDGYVWSDGTEFTVAISGQKHVQLCDGGWLKTNEKKDFGENRITLPITGGWTDLALVDIRTDYPAPLTITALGAQVSYGN